MAQSLNDNLSKVVINNFLFYSIKSSINIGELITFYFILN